MSEFFKQLLTLIKNDALKAALPPLATFFTNVSGNPSAMNLTVQLAKLQIDLLTALPTVEKDLFQAIATEINAQLSHLAK